MKKTLMGSKYRSMLLGGTLMMVVGVLLTISDSVVAGIMLGEDALAGVHLVTPLMSAVIFLYSLCTIGVPILYSREIGLFRQKEADRVFGTGLLVSVLGGVGIFLFILIAGDEYLAFFGASDAVTAHARGYLFWMNFAFLIMPLQAYLSAMVFADGDETVATAADIVQAAVNIPLSILLCRLIGSPGLGLGCFLATVCALAVSCLHLAGQSNSLHINLYFSPGILAGFLKFSIIDAASYFFLSVFSLCLEKYIVLRFGAGHLVTASVIITLMEMEFIFDGVGEAIYPIISMYLSEGAYQGVRKIYRAAERTSIAEGLLLALFIMPAAPLIPGVLGITDPQMVRTAITASRIIAAGIVFTSYLYLLSSYYLLREKIALGFWISALRDVLMPLPFAILFGNLFGLRGMFVGLAAAQPAAAAVTALYVIGRYGRENYPLLLAEEETKGDTELFEFDVTPDEIIRVRDGIEAILRARGYESAIITKAAFLAEEIFMFVRDMNEGSTVMGECILTMKDGHVRLIEKDNGRPFNPADEDMQVSSFRVYIISSLSRQWTPKKQHIISMSINRNVFEI